MYEFNLAQRPNSSASILMAQNSTASKIDENRKHNSDCNCLFINILLEIGSIIAIFYWIRYPRSKDKKAPAVKAIVSKPDQPEILIYLPKSIEKKPERNSISSTKPKSKNNLNQQKSITSGATVESVEPEKSKSARSILSIWQRWIQLQTRRPKARLLNRLRVRNK